MINEFTIEGDFQPSKDNPVKGNFKTTVDISRQLRDSIRSMKRGDPLYKLLKEELTKQGHWKNLPRGKPGFKKG